uniref:C-type lectin domain-containing protein n=1 Tax=Steinernema glaseri TaxID=37863 RepID=A0A1I7YGJ1_9BILA
MHVQDRRDSGRTEAIKAVEGRFDCHSASLLMVNRGPRVLKPRMLLLVACIFWAFPVMVSSDVKNHEGYPYCNTSNYRADFFHAVSCLGIVRVPMNQPDIETMNKRLDYPLEQLYDNHWEDPCLNVKTFLYDKNGRKLVVLKYDLDGGEMSYWIYDEPDTTYDPVVPFSSIKMWTPLGLRGFRMEDFNKMSDEDKKAQNAICDPELSAFDEERGTFHFFDTVVDLEGIAVTGQELAYPLQNGSCDAEQVHAKRKDSTWNKGSEFLDLTDFEEDAGPDCWNIDTTVKGAAILNQLYDYNVVLSRQSGNDSSQYFAIANGFLPSLSNWKRCACFLRNYRHDLLETYHPQIVPMSEDYLFYIKDNENECPLRNETRTEEEPCTVMTNMTTSSTTTTTATTSTTSSTTTTTIRQLLLLLPQRRPQDLQPPRLRQVPRRPPLERQLILLLLLLPRRRPQVQRRPPPVRQLLLRRPPHQRQVLQRPLQVRYLLLLPRRRPLQRRRLPKPVAQVQRPSRPRQLPLLLPRRPPPHQRQVLRRPPLERQPLLLQPPPVLQRLLQRPPPQVRLVLPRPPPPHQRQVLRRPLQVRYLLLLLRRPPPRPRQVRRLPQPVAKVPRRPPLKRQLFLRRQPPQVRLVLPRPLLQVQQLLLRRALQVQQVRRRPQAAQEESLSSATSPSLDSNSTTPEGSTTISQTTNFTLHSPDTMEPAKYQSNKSRLVSVGILLFALVCAAGCGVLFFLTWRGVIFVNEGAETVG